MRASINCKIRKGYLLLEMVMALGISALVLAGVFALADGSLSLSTAVIENTNINGERQAFNELLKDHFQKLPGNAVLQLETEETSSHNLPRLTFENVPMAFNWGGRSMAAESIELATVLRRDNLVDIVLRLYENKVITGENNTVSNNDDPIAEIIIVDGLYLFEVDVIDGRTMETLREWDDTSNLPVQVKFFYRYEPNDSLVEQAFWIVPKENPEVFMKSVQQQNPGGPQDTNTGGGTGGGGDDDNGSHRPPVVQ
ncbi:hypothetical protein [Persicirhabdus sediminis]|uniref:Uncharacterized protein n=1 Tax=Persicirhabdus sediminis TaxID=454144 RepID=A0A8J7SPW2_9BACT|nr:hypothetical protein [Persicirhabdus sediminis]MBK1792603.1 hypothetical protein [Persicirhabdus sediminis]